MEDEFEDIQDDEEKVEELISKNWNNLEVPSSIKS